VVNIAPNTRYGHRNCANCSSIVRTLNSGMSASTARTSSRIAAVAFAGSTRVRTSKATLRPSPGNSTCGT
jgi:hypothetical protein